MARVGFILAVASWRCASCKSHQQVYVRKCASWSFPACPDCGAIVAIPPALQIPAGDDPLAPTPPQGVPQ